MPQERGSRVETTRGFKRKQHGVVVAMAVAVAISLLALILAALGQDGLQTLSFVDRLKLTLQLDALVGAWLAATIANVARLRFVSEQDIGGSGSSDASAAVRQASAVTQNTLEQAVLAVAAHLGIAATFTRSQAILVVMVGLFSAGRLLFWLGYERGAAGRALGFGLTFYPSVLGLLATIGTLLIGILSGA